MASRGGWRPGWRGWVSALLVLGLLTLWLQIHLDGPVVGLDTAMRRWVHTHRMPVIRPVAQLVADLASPALVIVLMFLAVSALALRRRSWQPVVFAATATLLLAITVIGLKQGVGRVGPTGDGALAWPSGHTTTSVVASGVLVRLLCIDRRRIGALIVVAVPALVGISMVLRNYHWASDVLAGWLLGPLILIAAAALVQRLFQSRRYAVVLAADDVDGHAGERQEAHAVGD